MNITYLIYFFLIKIKIMKKLLSCIVLVTTIIACKNESIDNPEYGDTGLEYTEVITEVDMNGQIALLIETYLNRGEANAEFIPQLKVLKKKIEKRKFHKKKPVIDAIDKMIQLIEKGYVEKSEETDTLFIDLIKTLAGIYSLKGIDENTPETKSFTSQIYNMQEEFENLKLELSHFESTVSVNKISRFRKRKMLFNAICDEYFAECESIVSKGNSGFFPDDLAKIKNGLSFLKRELSEIRKNHSD